MGKTIGKCINKNLSSKYNPKTSWSQSAADALKTSSRRIIQKTTQATGDSIDNKIANRTTKVLRRNTENYW